MSSSNRVTDRVAVHAFGLRLEVRRHAMTKHRQGNPFDVIGIDAESSVHGGKCLGTGDQVLAGPRSRSPIHQFTNILRRGFILGPCRANQLRCVANHERIDRDTGDQLLHVQNARELTAPC